MIRYALSTAEVLNRIAVRRPTWLKRAAERTAVHKQLGRFVKKSEKLPNGKKASEFWGSVKEVFIRLQHGKCIYCETQLEQTAIQWDLEHLRPKDGVTAWTSKTQNIPTGPAMPQGYYLLAYDPENYAVACKVCNTNHKGTSFPIAHTRVIGGETVKAHSPEGAYLLFPLGDLADNPEDHIAFEGARPVSRNGSLRGHVTIELLRLEREGLEIRRARHLVDTFWPAYEGASRGLPKSMQALGRLLSDSAEYANCTRCYYRLCQDDPDRADRLYEEMQIMVGKDNGP